MKRHGIEVIVPDAEGRAATHDIIFNELCAGQVLDTSRETLFSLIEKAEAQGAESLIFGCTEICMILDVDGCPVLGFDSTDIHAAAAVNFALGNS